MSERLKKDTTTATNDAAPDIKNSERIPIASATGPATAKPRGVSAEVRALKIEKTCPAYPLQRPIV